MDQPVWSSPASCLPFFILSSHSSQPHAPSTPPQFPSEPCTCRGFSGCPSPLPPPVLAASPRRSSRARRSVLGLSRHSCPLPTSTLSSRGSVCFHPLVSTVLYLPSLPGDSPSYLVSSSPLSMKMSGPEYRRCRHKITRRPTISFPALSSVPLCCSTQALPPPLSPPPPHPLLVIPCDAADATPPSSGEVAAQAAEGATPACAGSATPVPLTPPDPPIPPTADVPFSSPAHGWVGHR